MADEPKPARPAETIPSLEGGMSAIASGNAPVIFFDNVPNFGTYNGIIHLTLSTMRFMPGPDGKSSQDHMIVAHLRMNHMAFTAMKDSLLKIEGMLSLPPPNEIN